jgi:hypothetical protein
MTDDGKRVRIRSFCPQCDRHIDEIGRAGDGPMRFYPCGHEVVAGGRIEVSPVRTVKREERM